MDKTRVDDMLINMISPKIQEIEEKFSSGKGLNQEDINTLLLKSQYNRINHLDDKLNEVTQSVVALENKFVGLENRFVGLENRFVGLEGKFDLLNEKIEHTIQKALNKNMFMLMGMMGFFLTLSKALDIFIK
jgi:predicted  nucleic acid-binding Zn-ribbon protein